MAYFKTDIQIMNEEAELKVYCPKCRHSVVLMFNTPKIVCSVCGRYIYNKNEIGQKQKFDDYLKTAIVKQKRKERERNAKNKRHTNRNTSN